MVDNLKEHGGGYWRIWNCTPPGMGEEFRVVRDEWSSPHLLQSDCIDVRIIHQWVPEQSWKVELRA